VELTRNDIDLSAYSKSEKYKLCLQQITALCEGESNRTANLANTAALLKEYFNWFWIGFYLVSEDELVLGPFQGPVACTRIAYGRGVCGTAWSNKNTIVVENVDLFPGHIACSASSKSEIVVPIIREGNVVAVIDADSEWLAHFDQADKAGLEAIAQYLATVF
jgi:L-methionine (R)-S-oxide reductase